jgi:hypothetical protein
MCHIMEREMFAVSAERLSVCGVLCCAKLAVLLVVTVL